MKTTTATYGNKDPSIYGVEYKSADDPFGSYFDATQIWSPVSGVNIYAGFHYTLKYKNE